VEWGERSEVRLLYLSQKHQTWALNNFTPFSYSTPPIKENKENKENKMIRTGRLQRPCIRCEEYWLPTGKGSRVCEKCIKKKEKRIDKK